MSSNDDTNIPERILTRSSEAAESVQVTQATPPLHRGETSGGTTADAVASSTAVPDVVVTVRGITGSASVGSGVRRSPDEKSRDALSLIDTSGLSPDVKTSLKRLIGRFGSLP